MIEYVMETYEPDLVLAGYPVTDEFSHQFLGLVTQTLPNGDPNPAFDDVFVDGTRDGRVACARASSGVPTRAPTPPSPWSGPTSRTT